MSIYGFNDKGTAERVAKKYGPGYGSGDGSIRQSPSGSKVTVVKFCNKSSTTVPPYGVVYATKVIDDGADTWVVEAKSWKDAKSSDPEAIKFPVINGPREVEPEEWGTSQDRQEYQVVRCTSSGLQLGKVLGPYSGSDANHEYSVKVDADEEVFLVVDNVESDVINGERTYQYAIVKLLSGGASPDSITFINKSTQTIQPYGVAFATKIIAQNEDNNSWMVEVKAWNEIKNDSIDKRALPFPIINGASEVPPNEIGSTKNRDGYWIAEVESKTVTLGGLLGPYDGPTASKKFMLSRESDEKIFESVDSIDAELFGGDASKYYALVRHRASSEEAEPLGFFVGTITALGDFPEGRSGTGGSPNFYNTRPGLITAVGTYISGSSNSGNFTVNAYYYGPFPLAVGAYVACLKWSTYGDGTGPEWWVVDASRYELPTRGPGGGVGGVG